MAAYAEIHEALRDYEKILVVGPQRSGTTIASHIIAADLGYRHVDEREIRWRDLLRLMRRLLRPKTPMVVHAPAFTPVIHWINSPHTVVVFMRRDPAAIKASQDRIDWTRREQRRQMHAYFRLNRRTDQPIMAETAYKCWERFQKPWMHVPFFELDYESLSSHPLWVPGERRAGFGNRQWREDEAPPGDQPR